VPQLMLHQTQRDENITARLQEKQGYLKTVSEWKTDFKTF